MSDFNSTCEPSDSPLAECDLLIQGSPASCLSYPPAVLELKKRYRFRRIGGESAGVLAACLTAAAECARSCGCEGGNAGFARLHEVCRALQDPGFTRGLLAAEPAASRPPVDLSGESQGVIRRGGVFTDWLAGSLDYVAFGRRSGTPLTLGDLWGPGFVPARRPERAPESGNPPVTDTERAPRVQLALVASDLLEKRCYQLPFEREQFLFKKSEFEELFPARVVAALLEATQAAKGPARAAAGAPPAGFHYLPAPEEFPVLVLLRLSLGQPLTPVPLYSTSGATVRRHRFGDGETSRTLPLELFEAADPFRPAFGIRLPECPDGGMFGPPHDPLDRVRSGSGPDYIAGHPDPARDEWRVPTLEEAHAVYAGA